MQAITIAQHLGGKFHVAREKRAADLRGTHHDLHPFGKRFNPHRRHAAARHGRHHLVGRSKGVVAQPVVVTQHQGRHAQPPGQVLLDKRFGGKLAEIPVEGQHLETVHSVSQAARTLLLQSGQQAQAVCVLLQDTARMRPESDQQALLPPLTGDGAQPVDHLLVSQMYAVEKTSRRYSHFTNSKS